VSALVADPDLKADSLSGEPRRNSSRQRKRPTSDMTLADGSPLRIPGAGDLDVDGDPFKFATLADDLLGITQGGHGFGIETVESTSPINTICRYCKGPLYRDQKPPEPWLCEFSPPMAGCRCNPCSLMTLWMCGLYRKACKPRIQCGRDECQRALRAEQKRRERARKNEKPKTQPVIWKFATIQFPSKYQLVKVNDHMWRISQLTAA
jgi:hypothetical protein